MHRSRILKRSFLSVCVLVYLVSAIRPASHETNNVSIDLSKPLYIEWPFEIAGVGDEGERGLRIGPKVGRGWKKEAGGKAFYRFYIPQEGEYCTWALSQWHGACSNAIYARFNEHEKGIIGNNPVYNQWHWVRGFRLFLEKGTHTLELSNHDDHVALRKVFLTNSQKATPDDAAVVFGDIFYDGFDGCGKGNFGSWKSVTGKWEVRNPCNPKNTSQNYLIGVSDTSALIIMNKEKWSNYALSVSFKPVSMDGPKSSIGLCFGLQNRAVYHYLEYSVPAGKNMAQMQMIRKTGARTEVLTIFDVPIVKNAWRQVDMELSDKQLVVMVDGGTPRSIPLTKPAAGGIGFTIQGQTTAYFDNVHVRQIDTSIVKRK